MNAALSAAETRITVATYNVHGCVGGDGRRDLARVARVLSGLRAHVIALQEIDCGPAGDDAEMTAESVELLAALSGYRAIWAPTRCTTRGHFGNAILSTLPVQRSRTIDLSYRKYEPRSALEVDFDVGGTLLRVIATHLGLFPSERRYQVRTLLAAAAEVEDAVTVLVGDINEWFLPGRPLRWLHARFGYTPAPRTFPARFPLLSLDRIWAHPSRVLQNVRVANEGEARIASDHLPVMGELDLALATTELAEP
jgi:endonuclease/exonuclease/phosphatase family metal-dependent hydrolase